MVSLDDIQVDEHLNYVERTMAILERKKKVLRNKEIPFVKVQWEHHRGSEWTWGRRQRCGSTIRRCLPQRTSRTKSSSSGGEL